MTQEEKAKKYDEVVCKLRRFMEQGIDPLITRADVQDFFPELKESEDEKIRKKIIDYFRGSVGLGVAIGGVSVKDMVSWLEKQGEQKPIKMWHDVSEVPDEMQELLVEWESPDATWHDIAFYDAETKAFRHLKQPINNVTRWAYVSDILSQSVTKTSEQGWSDALERQGEQKPADKVEPKFHEGEWITNGDYTWKIIDVKPLDYILQAQDGNIVDDTISHVDEQFHLFTIQDAKDGDVLASELCDSIILFKGIKDGNIDFYCDYDFSEIDIPGDRFTVNNGQHYGNVEDSKDFHPATKEQRDLLFKKMKEAGYEWNTEKKELKKIEQKTVQETKPFEAEHGKYYYCIKDYFCGGKKQASKGDVVQALRGLPIMGLKDASEYFLPVNFIKCNSAWSEEDEERLKSIISLMKSNRAVDPFYDKMCLENWLKSLKQRIGWKPSDEQMEALFVLLPTVSYGRNPAFSLYNDLKKLKGE